MKILARAGKMKLYYDNKSGMWVMMGGKYGSHSIYGPRIYNERVSAHWTGYLINNGFTRISVDNIPSSPDES